MVVQVASVCLAGLNLVAFLMSTGCLPGDDSCKGGYTAAKGDPGDFTLEGEVEGLVVDEPVACSTTGEGHAILIHGAGQRRFNCPDGGTLDAGGSGSGCTQLLFTEFHDKLKAALEQAGQASFELSRGSALCDRPITQAWVHLFDWRHADAVVGAVAGQLVDLDLGEIIAVRVGGQVISCPH
jgi:hypothetical protein